MGNETTVGAEQGKDVQYTFSADVHQQLAYVMPQYLVGMQDQTLLNQGKAKVDANLEFIKAQARDQLMGELWRLAPDEQMRMLQRIAAIATAPDVTTVKEMQAALNSEIQSGKDWGDMDKNLNDQQAKEEQLERQIRALMKESDALDEDIKKDLWKYMTVQALFHH